MLSYNLSYAQLILHHHDLAEIVIHEGVEMNSQTVSHFHAFLRAHLTPPFYILVNRVHDYRYDYMGQRMIAGIPEIKAIAVVVYNEPDMAMTQQMLSIPREVKWTIKVFEEYTTGLAWLEQQRENSAE